jgi:hypothetical protein
MQQDNEFDKLSYFQVSGMTTCGDIIELGGANRQPHRHTWRTVHLLEWW